jgi:hypothetical protein
VSNNDREKVLRRMSGPKGAGKEWLKGTDCDLSVCEMKAENID